MGNNETNKYAAKIETVKTAEVVEEVRSEETTKATEETKKSEVAQETTETVIDGPSPLYGLVSNCERLRIREKPDKNAEILTVINAGETVEIDKDRSTSNFYSVIAVVSGKSYEGYCMKDFITIE